MRSLVLACMLAVAAPAAADAAYFPVEIEITEVNDSSLNVDVGDTFGGEISYDPQTLAPFSGTSVTAIELDFDGTILTEDAAPSGVGVLPLMNGPAGPLNVGLVMSVDDVTVFGFGGELDFVGTGFTRTVGFFDDNGAALVRGDFVVTPVPAALPLLATGFAALAWWRRRRGRALDGQGSPQPRAA